MRAFGLFLIVAIGLVLPSCNRDSRREDHSARQVGRDAYRASRELKHDAKKAEEDLRNAGREVQEGWNEAKREDDSRARKK
jgi:hypothetical protein